MTGDDGATAGSSNDQGPSKQEQLAASAQQHAADAEKLILQQQQAVNKTKPKTCF